MGPWGEWSGAMENMGRMEWGLGKHGENGVGPWKTWGEWSGAMEDMGRMEWGLGRHGENGVGPWKT